MKNSKSNSPLREMYASIPEQPSQRMFYKDNINQCEYEQMHAKNKVMKEVEDNMNYIKS